VESNVKKVQHSSGGIVAEIHARNGDRVAAGDVLVRLDKTKTRANLAIVSKKLDEFRARKARLEAERASLARIRFPPEFSDRANDADLQAIISGERQLFELRQSARQGQKTQFRERIGQFKEEIAGLEAQVEAKSKEIALIERELAGARELWKKDLMTLAKLTNLERQAARLEGERAKLIARIARLRGKISEIDLQIIQIDRDLASEVGEELREVDAKIGELVERKVAAEDELRCSNIRAPQAGIVHESTTHTQGGVITAGDVIMQIVPTTDVLTVEAKVRPQDIDRVKIGRQALLRFTAFDLATIPELTGRVKWVSADASVDEQTGKSFFKIRIELAGMEVDRLGGARLVPGMPVETFIQTGDRKVISFLVKPLQDQITRAFRER
jgi:HlyD family secretion protein